MCKKAEAESVDVNDGIGTLIQKSLTYYTFRVMCVNPIGVSEGIGDENFVRKRQTERKEEKGTKKGRQGFGVRKRVKILDENKGQK